MALSEVSPLEISHDAISRWLSEKHFRPRGLWLLAKDTQAAYSQVASQYVQSHKMPTKKPSVLFQFFRAFLLLGSRDYWQLRSHEHLYAACLGLRQLWAAPLANFITMVVLHTVRWSVLQKAQEIHLIRLVGAENQFIRLPFLYFAGFLGLGAGILVCWSSMVCV